MALNPLKNERIIERALNALRDYAPDAKFKGKGLVDLVPQAERSMASRRRLVALDHETTAELAVREVEDEKTLAIISEIVDGVIGHEDFGDDSPLYEALGFVRRSKRKSGLTRGKRKSEVKEMK
ncbi:MAG: hypothetical protein JSS81_25510 [Acidobacteria bacterium]|nr:hypothetical protein [Acidobacteriota bacterium]